MKNKMKWTSMTAYWSAIINFIRKYVYPARIIAILLMAGATLPQVADAITVDLNYDKNNVPVITPVWSQEWSVANVLGGWVCRSNRNENEGACEETHLVWYAFGAYSKIRLRFREQISHAEITLILLGSVRDACYTGVINMNVAACQWGRSLKLRIPSEELAKIPTSGTWKATLVLDYLQWGGDDPLGTSTTDITLNVTDHFAENAAIYFPQFGTATPRVDLNLHRMNASQMSGRANLDMCLYDGGVKARSLQMKIEGSNKSGTGFQVIKSDSADTIDYAVSMNYGGRSIPVTRGVEFSLDNVDKAATRPVVLPGQRQAVRCVPVPLTLTTQPFNIREKRSGEYQGTLTVTMLMGTQTP
ncbi:TPA: fimbrial protein TcfD [Salmonella enterica subsp. enterica serovar Mississippi]|uniref:Fimbrial protein TcfD n=1 Tax=Salmonella enterica I TaxID=59201 RepID=A0A612M4A9_SALET|nr:fimbrial protein TcfD [Salmonella enterica]EBQ0176549.1 fimbrial protein TcfD [Salmonella enterica subsp. enterica]ECI1501246.1 fimbrial protein TcfD [Salmonella enterica subsp. enterica serovar Kentucky]EDT5583676.1 fimbrial protein TcfD [Salmonella enterica subsp. enterica serovar Choleraesuis]EBQ0210566.1 fimbrial protein TcfD [Salmonella enterica subsp. enterica]EBQ0231302.1 fimbrial protein TcfD [Salmonella enterica subsp. enterica]